MPSEISQQIFGFPIEHFRQVRVFAVVVVIGIIITPIVFAQANPQTRQLPATAPTGGPVVEGLQLSAGTERTNIPQGHPVLVRFSLKNVSAEVIRLKVADAERQAYLSVDDAKDQRVPLTRYGLHYENRDKWDWVSKRTRLLRPGESYDFSLCVSCFYDMSLPGMYYIQADYWVPRLGDQFADPSFRARSNRIAVEIVPDPGVRDKD